MICQKISVQLNIYKSTFFKILQDNYFSNIISSFKESKRKLLFQREKNEHVNVVKVNLYILYQGFFAINL